MHRARRTLCAMAAVSLVVVGASFAQASKAVVTSQSSLKWSDAGIPGVSTAAVEGDLAKGPSRFYLRYAAGFAAPVHHHSPDHYVTTVTGNLVLIVDGKEQRLAPGSYFAFTGKAPHAARCEGSVDCVMFVQALGAWDVVPEKSASAGH
jgi:mannose-6-phosphate isomerase-like protein (cupin superfamily)